MGKKILLVAPPDRKDFYDFLEKDKTNSYHLIWFDNKGQFESLKSSLASFIREQHYWADFASPQQLIKKLQPDKIVLMEMIDLHQKGLADQGEVANIIDGENDFIVSRRGQGIENLLDGADAKRAVGIDGDFRVLKPAGIHRDVLAYERPQGNFAPAHVDWWRGRL